jgi:hypothetical protein
LKDFEVVKTFITPVEEGERQTILLKPVVQSKDDENGTPVTF